MLGSPLFFIFIQNLRYLPKQDGWKIEASSDEKAHSFLSTLSPFFFSSFFLVPPLFFLPLPFPLSFLFLSAPTFSSSPLYHRGTNISPPLFVTPFFCCSSSIDFQHEPAHFSNTKDCDPIYRIPFQRLDTTLRADQSSQRPTLHPS